MDIATIVLGDFQTNCYCVRADQNSGDCLIIDPGLSPEPLVQMLHHNKLAPVSIVLTHGHADHIGGVETIRQHWPQVKVAIHKGDAAMLTDPTLNLSVMAGGMVQARPADFILDSDQSTFEAADMSFELMHTPGHSPGSISLYSPEQDILFAGDAIFAGSVGRTDFPGGSHELLIKMIQQKLLVLPDKTTVYPGHGTPTTIGNEKKFNPFLSGSI